MTGKDAKCLAHYHDPARVRQAADVAPTPLSAAPVTGKKYLNDMFLLQLYALLDGDGG